MTTDFPTKIPETETLNKPEALFQDLSDSEKVVYGTTLNANAQKKIDKEWRFTLGMLSEERRNSCLQIERNNINAVA